MQKPESLTNGAHKTKCLLSMAGDDSHGQYIKFLHYKENHRSNDGGYRFSASRLGFSGGGGDSGELEARVQSALGYCSPSPDDGNTGAVLSALISQAMPGIWMK